MAEYRSILNSRALHWEFDAPEGESDMTFSDS